MYAMLVPGQTDTIAVSPSIVRAEGVRISLGGDCVVCLTAAQANDLCLKLGYALQDAHMAERDPTEPLADSMHTSGF
jgi:hypothetical protein